MKHVANILQRIPLVKNPIPYDVQELLLDIKPLSTSEQKTIENLLEAGVPQERLIIALRNRLKRSTTQSATKTELSIETAVVSAIELPTDPHKPRRRPAHPTKRSVYVLNAFPEYQLPAWIGKTPPITQNLVAAYNKKELPKAFWDRIHALHKVQGKRLGISIHRVRAIKAIVPDLLGGMNVSSLRCFVCVQSIATQCGLTISRVSRALTDLANAGLLDKQLKRNSQGRYQALTITLTRKTLKILGVSEARLNQAQKMHKKLSKSANQVITKTKIVSDSVTESLASFKEATKQKVTKILSNTPNMAAILAKKVEEMLQDFGLGQECTSTG